MSQKLITLSILAGALSLPCLAQPNVSNVSIQAAAAGQAFSTVERHALVDGIAEYSFKVRVGSPS